MTSVSIQGVWGPDTTPSQEVGLFVNQTLDGLGSENGDSIRWRILGCPGPGRPCLEP